MAAQKMLPNTNELISIRLPAQSHSRNRNKSIRITMTISSTDINSSHTCATRLSTSKAVRVSKCKQQQSYSLYWERRHQLQWRFMLAMTFVAVTLLLEPFVPLVNADEKNIASNMADDGTLSTSANMSSPVVNESSNSLYTSTPTPISISNASTSNEWLRNSTKTSRRRKTTFNAEDSIFLRFAKRFTDDNNLVSGIIQDCYQKPTFSCFQKNVYIYLNEALDSQDVNVTQKLKFFKNQNSYQHNPDQSDFSDAEAAQQHRPTEASAAKDSIEEENEISRDGRSFTAETPIEEVTNALYGKSVKFAMTHDIELKLPEMMFDGATFRISPKSFEGNGVIAKLELIPKTNNEARLAGKFLMKKIQKFMKGKLLLSFLALVLIIKIIKIKLFWLLPLIIGVGAAKKLLLKFLLFLFPALSHLFKLCSYYQQTYHSTKYHHHHHHINHHHTVIPAWHSAENTKHVPELIYSHPPTGHVSAYLHGAPIHENYGPTHHEPYGAHSQSHETFENAWENSGPGLGSEYISDINRSAQVDEKASFFQPHSKNDANELHAWGLGTTPISTQKIRPPPPQHHQSQTPPLQKPPILNQSPSIQPQNYQKPQFTSHTFNPFMQQVEKQSYYNAKYRNNVPSQSAPSPVYTPARQPSLPPLPNQLKPQIQGALSAAAKIAAQYDPTRNQAQQPQHKLLQTITAQELTPELKEALRIQAEQRIVQQQQQILDKQPFVQDGQPLMPLNYDAFYSPILLKIDKIIEQLGINDELCKERVVCSMYKDPDRYSPHSNFVSAELSRDTNELQPITNTNQAVIRFFRLIQAARDGQDQKNCLALYPECSVNTE